ncbi:CRAL/TRIO domain-containing protein [Crepidotus variabilis]|uniref:CRAL/TRIO domain-containing protein n=1 Tax=Crepidotus variabilis TaxID=179855 RepID=A0A9P6JKG0_9AGAR|nr:CRAL/TRIO domain-containing protein [Crepidotus variabilis]
MGEKPANSDLKLSNLAGHVGHLSPEQETTLQSFKESLGQAKLYHVVDEAPSHDEATLLRFLRARSWNIAAAQRQFAGHEAWLKEHDVLRVLHEISPEDFLQTQKYYPRWTGRRDKLGIPIFVYRLASLEPLSKEIFSTPAETRYIRIAALSEHVRHFFLPLCTYLPHSSEPTPISSSISIIDLGNASFSLLWKLRSHMQEASTLTTANYPETIHTIAVVNSPSFFPTIWNWIKGWFDEGTRQKIHVLGSDPGEKLLELIDAENLPVQYGGSLEWKFEDEPNLDEDTKRVLGEMPKGSALFKDGKLIQPPPLPPSNSASDN